MGKALSQSPEWGAEAARNVAFRRGSIRADCSSSLMVSMAGLSQTACLCEAGPVGKAPKLADHKDMYEATSGSSGWH